MGDPLHDLRTQGFSILGVMEASKFEEYQGYLSRCLIYLNAHVPQTARNRGECPVTRGRPEDFFVECLCVPTDDAVLAPHLLEYALGLTDIVAAYLERDPPVMYSANVFWTRSGKEATRPDIQEFHRDSDDVRFLALFMYLTDVLVDADGPQDLEGPDGIVRTIYGAAGTLFLADTSRLHRGRKPQPGHLHAIRERGIAWIRWGVSDHPAANVWDKIEPVAAVRLGDRYPKDVRLRESIELLVV